jgi:hypothetical protein
MWRFLANVTDPNDPKDKQNKAKDRKEEYSEVELRKCCLGQSAKSKIPYHLINTHYIHSVVVQDFVSGRVCCVKQYHYESR